MEIRHRLASSLVVQPIAVEGLELQPNGNGVSGFGRSELSPRATTRAVRTRPPTGHGSGYIFLDHAQAQQYNPTRITAHETGHVLGLPDRYSGPCSELMSGDGPDPSCTNAYPDATERSRVSQLWADGFTSFGQAATFHTSK